MNLRRGSRFWERGSHFWKTGFTFMKIILSSCYWGVHTFEKGVHFLERGVHAFQKGVHAFQKKIWRIKNSRLWKILNNIGGGVHAFEKRFHIFEKAGFTFIKTLKYYLNTNFEMSDHAINRNDQERHIRPFPQEIKMKTSETFSIYKFYHQLN